jgi:hypothetical protein
MVLRFKVVATITAFNISDKKVSETLRNFTWTKNSDLHQILKSNKMLL